MLFQTWFYKKIFWRMSGSYWLSLYGLKRKYRSPRTSFKHFSYIWLYWWYRFSWTGFYKHSWTEQIQMIYSLCACRIQHARDIFYHKREHFDINCVSGGHFLWLVLAVGRSIPGKCIRCNSWIKTLWSSVEVVHLLRMISPPWFLCLDGSIMF